MINDFQFMPRKPESEHLLPENISSTLLWWAQYRYWIMHESSMINERSLFSHTIPNNIVEIRYFIDQPQSSQEIISLNHSIIFQQAGNLDVTQRTEQDVLSTFTRSVWHHHIIAGNTLSVSFRRLFHGIADKIDVIMCVFTNAYWTIDK